MNPGQEEPDLAKVVRDSHKLNLGALAEEMSDWVDFDLDGIDWVKEIPQWAELYSSDAN